MTLTEFLTRYHPFTEAEKVLITENTSHKSVANKAFFVESGHRSNEVGFIETGVFRYFFYDAEGREITSHFMATMRWLGTCRVSSNTRPVREVYKRSPIVVLL